MPRFFMIFFSPSAAILVYQIHTLAEAESIDGLHRVLEMVRDISEGWKRKALITISKALALVKDRQGLELVIEMSGPIPSTYEKGAIMAELAGIWAQLDDLEYAFNIIPERGLYEYEYRTGLINIAKVLGKKGKPNELQQILKMVQSDQGYIDVLISVAEAYARRYVSSILRQIDKRNYCSKGGYTDEIRRVANIRRRRADEFIALWTT